MQTISTDKLRELVSARETVERLEAEIGFRAASMPNGTLVSVRGTKTDKERKAEYQKARYHRLKAAGLNPMKPLRDQKPENKRRTMSPAMRAKIAASARRRWKLAREAGRNHL